MPPPLVIDEFVVNSGRALVMPIWWGSYRRWISETLDAPGMHDLQREQAVAWHRDLSATLDYLESRSDIGKFDYIAPYERSQRPLFNLLGTPANQKKHIVYDGGHFQYPSNSVAHDTSNWFDEYLGAAR